ncbi:MAG TPA: TIGR02117 family protein [Ferrovibrio sp.]|uniref:TIGR02117 family protein n=1 Tax=Ferrovibrio sp. TaxID=1917215 RepID=UPI002ED52F7B
MRSLRRALLILVLVILAVPALYGLAALILGSLPAPHRDPLPGKDTVPVYLLSNGWHVWLALPVKEGEGEQATDWTEWLPPTDFAADVSGRDYIAFGWGDRAFYLHTRRPADFRPDLALFALLGRGPAAMHVMRLPEPDPTDGDVRRIDADPLQYHALVSYIRRGFALGPDGRPQQITGAAYSGTDAFYQAVGRYSPLRTCNEWIGAALRSAALRAGLWTPFPFGLMN